MLLVSKESFIFRRLVYYYQNIEILFRLRRDRVELRYILHREEANTQATPDSMPFTAQPPSGIQYTFACEKIALSRSPTAREVCGAQHEEEAPKKPSVHAYAGGRVTDCTHLDQPDGCRRQIGIFSLHGIQVYVQAGERELRVAMPTTVQVFQTRYRSKCVLKL